MKIRMLKGWFSNTFSSEQGSCEYDSVDENLAKYLIKIGFAEEIKEPVHVPYKAINPDWWHKELKNKHKMMVVRIVGLDDSDNEPVIKLQNWEYDYNFLVTLEQAFGNYTWQDGSPFGEQEPISRRQGNGQEVDND